MFKPDDPVYIVAEIGINHNGSLDRAQALIAAAHAFGANAVKFQKRTVDIVYTKEELDRPRESPFGKTNGDLKRGLEFGYEEYTEIDRFCRELGIDWFASPWDQDSVSFLCDFNVPYLKVASACLTDADLLVSMATTYKPLLVSTGMADMEIIKRAVRTILEAGGNIACLYHCTSTYPCEPHEINLRVIPELQKEFGLPIGYSGHETGVPISVMACAMGAVSVERHITLRRSDWGSDQAASLDLEGFRRLCRDIRLWEEARGDGVKQVYASEEPIAKKLRRNFTI